MSPVWAACTFLLGLGHDIHGHIGGGQGGHWILAQLAEMSSCDCYGHSDMHSWPPAWLAEAQTQLLNAGVRGWPPGVEATLEGTSAGQGHPLGGAGQELLWRASQGGWVLTAVLG